MIQAPCLLPSLPRELLLYQLTFFPDLASHLAFSVVCQRIYALYNEHLWRRISISSGLGKPLDLVSSGVSWRALCITAVVHARACRLPDCSEHNLSRGRPGGLLVPPCNLVYDQHRVQNEVVELNLSRVFEGLTGDLEDLYSASIPCDVNYKPWLFKSIFKKSDLLSSAMLTHVEDQVFTKLAHHLPASCALATVPAVNRLDLDIGREVVHVRNRDGVCIWDVVSALARKMFETVPSATTDGGKAPMRIYQLIASEWQQHVLLRLSLHGPGSINAHVDIGEEIYEDYVSPASL